MNPTHELAVRLVRRNWDPETLLASLDSSMIPDQEQFLKVRKQKLWKDTYAEYDARHLQAEVAKRGLIETPEAEAFLAAWAADEERHTRGFVRLLQLASDIPPAETWAELLARTYDFSALDRYLECEFSVLVTIAFDEVVTCRAYSEDRDFYRALGSELYSEWLRNLIADEAAHFRNAVAVLRARSPHRLSEVEEIVDALVGVREATEYKGTFVLDHFGEHYTIDMLMQCRNSLLRSVNRKNAP